MNLNLLLQIFRPSPLSIFYNWWPINLCLISLRPKSTSLYTSKLMSDQFYWIRCMKNVRKYPKNTVFYKSVISGLFVIDSHAHWSIVVGMLSFYQVISDGGLVFWAHFFDNEGKLLYTTLKRSFSSSWLLKVSLRMDLFTVSSITSSNRSFKIAFILSIT